MAVLSKHGSELYRYEGITFRLSFRTDGNIMRNNGNGWKLWKRCKAGVDPAEYAERQREYHLQKDRENPGFVRFRALMQELVPFQARYWVQTAIQHLPDNPDGVYTELSESSLRYTDYDPELSIDDCVDLCQAYKVATTT